MIDKVSDIYNNIKDRVSNPLFFSFVCAWLVYNWQITVALLWYDTNQINMAGYPSIFDFIAMKWKLYGSFWIPVIYAVAYTVLIPVVKSLIRLFNSYVLKYADKWDLNILEGSVVSMDKYLKYRKLYLNRTKELDKIIVEESELANENDKLRTEKNNLDGQIKNFEEQIKARKDFTYLNGYWKCYKEAISAIGTSMGDSETDIYISNDSYYDITNVRRDKKYMIDNFNYNVDLNEIFFVKRALEGNNSDYFTQNLVNILTVAGTVLRGTENGYHISYERIERTESNVPI